MLKNGRNGKNDVLPFLLVTNDIFAYGTSLFSLWESLYQILLFWVSCYRLDERTISYVNDSNATDFNGGNGSGVGSWYSVNSFQPNFILCWIDFSSIMLTFLYLSVTIENVSVTSKALVDDNGSMLCSMVVPNLTCFQLFATSGMVRVGS